MKSKRALLLIVICVSGLGVWMSIWASSANDSWLKSSDGVDAKAVNILQRADAACEAAKVVQYNASFHKKGSRSRVSGMFLKDIPNKRLRIDATRTSPVASERGAYEYSWADTTCRFVSHLDQIYMHGAYSGFNSLPRDVWGLNMFELGLNDPFGDELKGLSRYEGQEWVEGVLCDIVYVKYKTAGSYARWYVGTDALPRKVERYLNMFPDLPASQRVVRVLTIRDLVVDPPVTDDDYVVPAPEGYTEHILQPGPLIVGSTAPNWTLETADGDNVRLEDLRGSVVLMCFLAANNPMNQRVIDGLQELHEHFADQPVKVLGVSCDEQTRDNAVDRMKSLGYTFALLINGADVAKTYAVQRFATTYIIDSNGRVAHSGSSGSAVGYLKNAIRQRLPADGASLDESEQ
ncbi:MAG: TlpA family protein disulfide reductase [Phycisphaerales bacterium]|nr:MAG: TlpA family protein disulfide reductase [Phycisphaerales bacterium]